MGISYQLVIDCASPEPLAQFWAEALHYVIEPPPAGHESWDECYRSIGVPEEELGGGADSIADPDGEGPRIWFQVVPERKSIKNRFHIDVRASGDRTPRSRPAAPSWRPRLRGWRARCDRLHAIEEEGLDHYAVAMADPEGNEFDIN